MAASSPITSSIEGNSQESTESYEVVLPVPKRKGQVRGKGARRGGGTSGGGVRGRRKRTGAFLLTPDETVRLEQLSVEKKRRADELVDELSEDGAKRLLKLMAEKMPSIVLDVAEELNRERGQEPEEPIENQQELSWPSWCVCHRCREMPGEDAKVCCGMRPDLCTSVMPEMRLAITDQGVLQLQQLFRSDIFARAASSVEHINKSLRHSAYRQFILFQYGRMGHGVRRAVPSCCTWFIRDKFPDPNGFYVEFNRGW